MRPNTSLPSVGDIARAIFDNAYQEAGLWDKLTAVPYYMLSEETVNAMEKTEQWAIAVHQIL